MTEEKTIERLKDLIHTCDTGIKEHGKYDDFFKEDKEAIKTVLNMLKEKDKEIEHQIEKRNNQKAELAILNEKQKEMNKLINTVKSYKGQMKKEIKRIKSLEKEAQKYFEENIKKDKIIDLMAEQLEGVPINKNIPNFEKPNLKECITIFTNKEDIKQYFERKAEKE